MTDHADAARRRELQRRAFAAGGGLTADEAEELRMLSAPAPAPVSEPVPAISSAPQATDRRMPVASDPKSADASPAKNPATEAMRPAASDPAASDSAEPDSAASDSAASDTAEPAPARRPRRMLAIISTAVALVLSVGAGWLSAPRAEHATPSMTVAQQQIEDEIIAGGDFDAGTVQFRGAKEGAEFWSALKGDKQCVILNVGDQRATGCELPDLPLDSLAIAFAQLQTHEGDRDVVFSGYLLENLSGGVSPIIERAQMGVGNWESQFSPEELKLIEALEKTGARASEAQILDYDGDLPIWIPSPLDQCIAIVDPADQGVSQSCAGPDGVSEIDFHDSIYRVVWSARRGAVLTILKQATSTRITCDTETGDCTWVDDTPVEAG